MDSCAHSTCTASAPADEVPFFVCVHVGAGCHEVESEKSLRRLLHHACRVAADVVSRQGDLAEAVTDAISVLEDSELTNAGRGANLNFDGEVECDASIMTGTGRFGAVGVASGVKNPIKAARRLADLSEEPLPLGRVRPIFLAGEGVRQWALSEGIEAVRDKTEDAAMHVTPEARRKWQYYREILEANANQQNSEATPKAVNDTVGCIVVNSAGEVCSGVSSGGIAMKVPGRVGEAAIYGAGCWAHNAERQSESSVACSVSGVGEVVTRGLSAMSCAESFTKKKPLDCIRGVIDSRTTGLPDPKDVGIMAVRTSASRRKGQQEMQVELCVVHNAESMGFAYLTSNSKPAVHFLRHHVNDGSIVEFGTCARWQCEEPL